VSAVIQRPFTVSQVDRLTSPDGDTLQLIRSGTNEAIVGSRGDLILKSASGGYQFGYGSLIGLAQLNSVLDLKGSTASVLNHLDSLGVNVLQRSWYGNAAEKHIRDFIKVPDGKESRYLLEIGDGFVGHVGAYHQKAFIDLNVASFAGGSVSMEWIGERTDSSGDWDGDIYTGWYINGDEGSGLAEFLIHASRQATVADTTEWHFWGMDRSVLGKSTVRFSVDHGGLDILALTKTGDLALSGGIDIGAGKQYTVNGTVPYALAGHGHTLLPEHIMVGRGTARTSGPSRKYLLTLAEDASDIAEQYDNRIGAYSLQSPLYMQPTFDQDIGPTQISAGEETMELYQGLQYTDGNYNLGREHWDSWEYGDTVEDAWHEVIGTARTCESITITATELLHYLDFKAYRTGSGPITLTLTLYATDGVTHKPTGGPVGSGTFDASALTTDPAGEVIEFILSTYKYVGAGVLALVITSSSWTDTVYIAADETSGGYATGWGFTSTDGVNWTEIGAGGIGDFLFETFAARQNTATSVISGHAINFITSNLSSMLFPLKSNIYLYNLKSVMIGLPATCTIPKIVGYGMTGFAVVTPTVATAGYGGEFVPPTGTFTRTYGVYGGTGSGVTFAGMFAGDAQATGKWRAGSSTTALGTVYWWPSATNVFTVATASTDRISVDSVGIWSAVRGAMSLGKASFGFKDLWLKDSITAYELRILATCTGIAANRILTLDVGNADRVLTLSGNPTLDDWFDQNVKIAAAPQFARIGLGAASDGTRVLKIVDAAAAPTLAGTPPTFTDYYGGDGKALGDPSEWIYMQTAIGTVKIPGYAT